jgi:hypothetical protein
MDFDFDSWDDPTDVCGACGFGGQVACAPDCPEFLRVEHEWDMYQLQLAAEQEAEEARAAFWHLWKFGGDRVKRLRPAYQRDDVQWC